MPIEIVDGHGYSTNDFRWRVGSCHHQQSRMPVQFTSITKMEMANLQHEKWMPCHHWLHLEKHCRHVCVHHSYGMACEYNVWKQTETETKSNMPHIQPQSPVV